MAVADLEVGVGAVPHTGRMVVYVIIIGNLDLRLIGVTRKTVHFLMGVNLKVHRLEILLLLGRQTK